MSMTFSNSVVVIGGKPIYATQANIDEKADFQRVDSLGYSSVGAALGSRTAGTFSIDFYWTDEDLFEFFDMETFGEDSIISGSIGTIGFQFGYITEISLTAEALSVIKGSIKGEFIGKINRSASSSETIGIPSFISDGAASSVSSSPSFLTDAFSVEITKSRSISPIFKMGAMSNGASSETLSDYVLGWNYGGGETRCSINGVGLQSAIETCESNKEIELSLNSSCRGNGDSITVEGLTISNSSVSVNKNEDVVGKIELVKYF